MDSKTDSVVSQPKMSGFGCSLKLDNIVPVDLPQIRGERGRPKQSRVQKPYCSVTGAIKPGLSDKFKLGVREQPKEDSKFTTKLRPTLIPRRVMTSNKDYITEEPSPHTTFNTQIPTLGQIYRSPSNNRIQEWLIETPELGFPPVDCEADESLYRDARSSAATLKSANSGDGPISQTSEEQTIFESPKTVYQTTKEETLDWLPSDLEFASRDNESGYRSLSPPCDSTNNIENKCYTVPEMSKEDNVQSEKSLSRQSHSPRRTWQGSRVGVSGDVLLVDRAVEPVLLQGVSKKLQYPSGEQVCGAVASGEKRRRRPPVPTPCDVCASERLERTMDLESAGLDSSKVCSSYLETAFLDGVSSCSICEVDVEPEQEEFCTCTPCEYDYCKVPSNNVWKCPTKSDGCSLVTCDSSNWHYRREEPDYFPSDIAPCGYRCYSRRHAIRRRKQQNSQGYCRLCQRHHTVKDKEILRKRSSLRSISRHRWRRVWRRTAQRCAFWSRQPSAYKLHMMDYVQMQKITNGVDAQTSMEDGVANPVSMRRVTSQKSTLTATLFSFPRTLAPLDDYSKTEYQKICARPLPRSFSEKSRTYDCSPTMTMKSLMQMNAARNTNNRPVVVCNTAETKTAKRVTRVLKTTGTHTINCDCGRLVSCGVLTDMNSLSRRTADTTMSTFVTNIYQQPAAGTCKAHSTCTTPRASNKVANKISHGNSLSEAQTGTEVELGNLNFLKHRSFNGGFDSNEYRSVATCDQDSGGSRLMNCVPLGAGSVTDSATQTDLSCVDAEIEAKLLSPPSPRPSASVYTSHFNISLRNCDAPILMKIPGDDRVLVCGHIQVEQDEKNGEQPPTEVQGTSQPAPSNKTPEDGAPSTSNVERATKPVKVGTSLSNYTPTSMLSGINPPKSHSLDSHRMKHHLLSLSRLLAPRDSLRLAKPALSSDMNASKWVENYGVIRNSDENKDNLQSSEVKRNPLESQTAALVAVERMQKSSQMSCNCSGEEELPPLVSVSSDSLASVLPAATAASTPPSHGSTEIRQSREGSVASGSNRNVQQNDVRTPQTDIPKASKPASVDPSVHSTSKPEEQVNSKPQSAQQSKKPSPILSKSNSPEYQSQQTSMNQITAPLSGMIKKTPDAVKSLRSIISSNRSAILLAHHVEQVNMSEVSRQLSVLSKKGSHSSSAVEAIVYSSSGSNNVKNCEAQTCLMTCNAETESILSDLRQQKSAVALTSRCILPPAKKCCHNSSHECLFVYEQPRCVTHRCVVHASVQMEAPVTEIESKKKKKPYSSESSSDTMHASLDESSRNTNTTCYCHSNSFGQHVLTPKVYKALYEKTRHVVKGPSKKQPASKDFGIGCVTAKPEILQRVATGMATSTTSTNNVKKVKSFTAAAQLASRSSLSSATQTCSSCRARARTMALQRDPTTDQPPEKQDVPSSECRPPPETPTVVTKESLAIQLSLPGSSINTRKSEEGLEPTRTNTENLSNSDVVTRDEKNNHFDKVYQAGCALTSRSSTESATQTSSARRARQKSCHDITDDCLKSHLLASCRYYSNMLTKHFGRPPATT